MTFDGSAETIPPALSGFDEISIIEFNDPVGINKQRAEIHLFGNEPLFPERGISNEGEPQTNGCVFIGTEIPLLPVGLDAVEVGFALADGSGFVGKASLNHVFTDITSNFPELWNGTTIGVFPGIVGSTMHRMSINIDVEVADVIFYDGFESGDVTAWSQ